MKVRLLLVAIACAAALSADAYAQPGGKAGGGRNAQRSPADQALAEFGQAYNDPAGKFDEARFQKVIDTGFAFLVKYPDHAQAPYVAFDLGGFGAKMTDKALIPMRAVFASRLNYEVLNQKGKDVTPEAKVAIAAVDAALADFVLRSAPGRENVTASREKIDALAALPGSSRFLIMAERSFADALARTGKTTATAEAHLKKLLDHPNKELAEGAREDLNLIEIRKEPFAAKFTALDGKEYDFAQQRGKVVVVVYFRATDPNAAQAFERWKAFHTEHKKKGFEIVAVSHDAAADKDKLVKWIADKKVTWPVYFDGKEAAGDFAPKITVKHVPQVALFDQKGILRYPSLPPQSLEPAVRQELGIKETASAPEPEPGPSSGRRR